ncbi:thiolase family protein [Eubacteriales bacterium OttesenSCG-928-N14]|nr:thiolase family protein [Eubacteriales bacterium OttesenSCG-928-N14]
MSELKLGPLNRSVSIVGVGYTPFGFIQKTPEILDFTERELIAMAFIEALQDAGLEAKDVDAAYVGQYMSETLSHSNSVGGLYADWLGLRLKPLFHMEGACCSSTLTLRNAVQLVASGLNDIVASVAVETTSCAPTLGKPAHLREQMPSDELWEKTMYGSDHGYVYWAGVPTSFDGCALDYAKKYDLSLEQMDDILNMAASNNRRAGVLNPKATQATQTFDEMAKEQGMSSGMEYLRSDFNPKFSIVARMLHNAITADGASAIIVMATDEVKKRGLEKRAVQIAGFGTSAATLAPQMDQYMGAIKQAYQMAGITNPRKEVDYFSPHDCLIARQFSQSEAAGYFEPGEAWKYILEGRTAYDGDRPFHTSGGRSSMGHAWSASAGAEVAEAVAQMRGECGQRQVKVPVKTAVVMNEGAGPNANVTVLKKL